MSSLCRNFVVRATALSLAILAFSSAWAADGYFIPELTVNGEWHTNVDLIPDSQRRAANPALPNGEVGGYSALASGIFGVRTPRNVTEVRPRIQFYDYPDREELRRTNQYLDFKSLYDSPRNDWELIGSYWKQTTFEAQRADPEFDEFDPNDPTVDTPSSTSIVSRERTRIQVRPTYSHEFSERFGAELNGFYERMEFDSEGRNLDDDDDVNYNYFNATGLLLWAMSQRTKLGAGFYGSKYDGEDADQVDSKGIEVGIEHAWSPTMTAEARVNFERTEVEDRLTEDGEVDNVGFRTDTSNNAGLRLGFIRNSQISQIRVDLQRTFSPSSAGSRNTLDQFRMQYVHRFTQRWSFLTAIRAYLARDQGGEGEDDARRDYMSANTQLSWNVTRTWSVMGGYSYYWRKYSVNPDAANDSVVNVGITYKGMRPQRN